MLGAGSSMLTAARSLRRRMSALNRGMLPLIDVGERRREYTTTGNSNDSSNSNSSSSHEPAKKTYVRIGNSSRELKASNAPEKIPRGYLRAGLSGALLADSAQAHLRSLRWLMQKDELRQDAFLIGSPPGAHRRRLALAYAELTRREVEYLCLTRDTTEADIKQRREISAATVQYANQCAVSAALHGRLLIIEGIEKAERNLLPILNNLLENRELNLDSGHFLVAPERYDKLARIADAASSSTLTSSAGNGDEAGAMQQQQQQLQQQQKQRAALDDLNLLRVHEDFRVIAIGLPVPKYKGNLLDPPLRSRFQAHLVSLPEYDDFARYLSSSNKHVPPELIKSLCDFGYSFYTAEMGALNLPDFPLENLDKVVRILDKCRIADTNNNNNNNSCSDTAAASTMLNASKLLAKLYPHPFLLKRDQTSINYYAELQRRFGLPTLSEHEPIGNNAVDYRLESVEVIRDDTNSSGAAASGDAATATLRFAVLESNDGETATKESPPPPLVAIDMVAGTGRPPKPEADNSKDGGDGFVMNAYHSSQLVDMMLSHSAGADFCLIGAPGAGKSELIRQFARRLAYHVRTVYLYRDMSARDLLQQRVTAPSGDTAWVNSPIVDAALRGHLVVLDGIHRLKDDTLMSLRRLVQDRELDLLDGTKLLAHDKYDALMSELATAEQISATSPPTPPTPSPLLPRVLRIHPAFRIVATAEPPIAKSTLKDTTKASVAASVSSSGESTKKNQQQAPTANASSNNEWLNSEVLNLFMYQSIEPLELRHERAVLSRKFALNERHDQLLELVERLKRAGDDEAHLRHVARLFSLRKLITLSRKLEKYPATDLRQLIESASLAKFMPQLNKEILAEFLSSANIVSDAGAGAEHPVGLDARFAELEAAMNESETPAIDSAAQSLSELAKIPDTLFYENRLHRLILNNLLRDFELGEHLLLIGNQGTGKNKLVDKFLMLTSKPREYIQLHRDTTVHALTVQPVIRDGRVHYEDSPLVKAVRQGRILVVDEADKAPLHVTCVLKSLIESGEMMLSDGRRIVRSDQDAVDAATAAADNTENSSNAIIRMHPNFRMIILANRPGFPFLGNDFFAILGDLLACHPIDNPDAHSEIEMLRMYAPSVSEPVLGKLVAAFGSLRQLSDQGLISYPYSTREIVNVVRHLQRFPADPLASVLSNVYDFDHYAEQGDLKSTFGEVMRKHGIPIGVASVQVHLAAETPLPALLPLHRQRTLLPAEAQHAAATAISQLTWTELSAEPMSTSASVERYACDKHEARVDSFSELRAVWHLGNKQQLVNDLLVVGGEPTAAAAAAAVTGATATTTPFVSSADLIYSVGTKPLSVVQTNPTTSQAVEIPLAAHFSSAWRLYYPRLTLLEVPDAPHQVLVHEQATGEVLRVDFATSAVHRLERSALESASGASAKRMMRAAKKSISKYFTDSTQSHRALLTPHRASAASNDDGDKCSRQRRRVLVSHRHSGAEIQLADLLGSGREVSVRLRHDEQLRVNQVHAIGARTLLVAAYDATRVDTSDNVTPADLLYYILEFDDQLFADDRSLGQTNEHVRLFAVDKNLFAFHDDLLLPQIEQKQPASAASNPLDSTRPNTPPVPSVIAELTSDAPAAPSDASLLMLPSIHCHLVALPTFSTSGGDLAQLSSYFCRREVPLTSHGADPASRANVKARHLQPVVKSIVDASDGQLIRQVVRRAAPPALAAQSSSSSSSSSDPNLCGYLELIDLERRSVRYLRVSKPTSDAARHEAWHSYSHLGVINEAEFLVDVSPSVPGNVYTLDFHGRLSEWETGRARLQRSLDDWHRLVADREARSLRIDTYEVAADSPRKELPSELGGPKHGKVDEQNAPHSGGNTWAGGSGGFDTAGLGGAGGPYRLDSGNRVFQVSDQVKQSVPESVRRAARDMAEQAFRQRLREIQMSAYEHDLYSRYLAQVQRPVQQLRNILEGLEAKRKERQWLKHQTHGDLDDAKLVEAITGEKNVFRRRGDDPHADNERTMEQPKRLRLVVDVSGSMYRFNGVDNRLERQLESVLMVMEAFSGFDAKIVYDVVGHSGDGHCIRFVDAQAPPRNEADRLRVLKTMLAHAQFCSSGDNTFEATVHAIRDVARFEADDHFVIVLSDANFDRYGLSPRRYAQILLETEPRVNAFCIFVGTLGDQAQTLKKALPLGKSFVCLNTQDVPKIMQQIFQAALLNQ